MMLEINQILAIKQQVNLDHDFKQVVGSLASDSDESGSSEESLEALLLELL